ncbi:MAG: serine/threonine-protein phosphatase [Bacteroidetes bacterium]|nr:serine/threonine-protein phosphatase [Bacteroidota bacterium]MBU1114915.1 serine/threonine-protein phosphatase [Bacteroidota bacterium]MBU1798390.1 serine/threonine-protein phosphatase [Bacteroidota bacterium]
MDIDLLTEKLSLQVQSFQESFEMLSNSFSISAMALAFEKIIRGNFVTTQTSIYYRFSETSEWESLVSKNDYDFAKISKFDFPVGTKILSDQDSNELVIITKLNDNSALAIILGSRLSGEKYSDIDKVTLQIFVQLFDNASQSFLLRKNEKQLIFSLNNKVAQLNNLIDTGIEISKISIGDELLELVLFRAITLTNASFGRIQQFDENKLVDEIVFPPNIVPGENKVVSQIGYSFNNANYRLELYNKESRSGIIRFDETDELLINAIIKQVESAIENKKLHKEALENEVMKSELAVASEIQKRILPDVLPQIKGYDLAGINIPSKEVSGDYYNVYTLKDGRYAHVVADVTGKGMPASLLVSTLDASLQSYLDMQTPLSEIALKLNSIVFNASTSDRFITFFIAILNPDTGEMEIVNAGHNPALILKNDNSIYKINAGGIAFGMFDMGLPFDVEKLTLQRGERLFIFSDGIPEAMDKDENEYSDERLEKFFTINNELSSNDFINLIIEDVKSHANGEPQSDDITAIYLIRNYK